jgi:hypothetical protein
VTYTGLAQLLLVLPLFIIRDSYSAESPRLHSMPPFAPTFRSVDAAIFAQYSSDYTEQGLNLRTLSAHLADGVLLVSGSFQRGTDDVTQFEYYLAEPDFQQTLINHQTLGFRPRDLGVTLDSHGNPRFSGLWKKQGSELTETHVGWTDVEYEDGFSHLFSQGYRVEDGCTYLDRGVRKHAVTFVKDGNSDFYAIYGYLPANFLNFFRRIYQSGYRPTSLHLEENQAGHLIDSVFMKEPGTWIAKSDLSPDEYDSQAASLVTQGYRLWKIQGYDNSTHFAAIWQLPSNP